MLSNSLIEKLNTQMNVERTNEAIYWQLASILDNLNWAGSAKKFYAWADEERSHFVKIKDWLIDENAQPQLDELQAVNILGNAPDEILPYYEAALKVEQENTARFKKLYEDTLAEDKATAIWMEWFLLEQVDSEHELIDILQLLRRMTKGEQALWDLGLLD